MSEIKFACPCCGYGVFNEQPLHSYNICQICFWEDNPIQREDLDLGGGANRVALKQEQKNFIEFGACERDMIKNVRQPKLNEQRDANWKPFD